MSADWMPWTTASLSAIFACKGISSQMSKPGTLVRMGLNSPRISTGASGFMSYMSTWLGPPGKYTKITPLCGVCGEPPRARRRNKSASVRPPMPKAPTLKKSRRRMPSHIRCGLPQGVNMTSPSFWRERRPAGVRLPTRDASGVRTTPERVLVPSSEERRLPGPGDTKCEQKLIAPVASAGGSPNSFMGLVLKRAVPRAASTVCRSYRRRPSDGRRRRI
jgi:hypothetical protein